MILSEAKSGSFLQRRSVMPGGAGKVRPQRGGKGGNGGDGFMLVMFYILVGQGDILEKFHLGIAAIWLVNYDWLWSFAQTFRSLAQWNGRSATSVVSLNVATPP